MSTVLITALSIMGVGLVCGLLLAFIAKHFSVKEDPRIGQAQDILPGANCGGCGFAGCAAYAKAVVVDGAELNCCAPGGDKVVEALSKLTGREGAAAEPMVAVIMCTGDDSVAVKKSAYNGIVDCGAANIVAGGGKGCAYGCLGYGSCIRACAQSAISIVNGIAKVNYDRCGGCGACSKVCPRNLIQIVPRSRNVHVLCSSPDKGAAVRNVCKKGCIGCGICVKTEGGVAMSMAGSIARIDYEKVNPESIAAAMAKCPTKCLTKMDLEKKGI